jgi:2-dehydro-3-deoxyglucarate aldolase/4-hydroxy-2-oxoheptanedioate aldolase
MDKVFRNPLKHRLSEGEKTAGAWVQLGSPMSAEILSRAGFDWLIIDLEHGAGDIPTLISQIQAMNGYKAVPLVRAPWNDFVIIKRILDAGAYGVLIPSVSTGSEAEDAVLACKYPPAGIRGAATSARAAGFGWKPHLYFSTANDEIMIITQVETAQAISNLDEILEVADLDGVFIGPSDLAASMGHLGNPTHPEVQEAITFTEAKVLRAEKLLATMATSWEQAKVLYERGYQMVTLMADGVALAMAAGELTGKFESL